MGNGFAEVVKHVDNRKGIAFIVYMVFSDLLFTEGCCFSSPFQERNCYLHYAELPACKVDRAFKAAEREAQNWQGNAGGRAKVYCREKGEDYLIIFQAPAGQIRIMITRGGRLKMAA